MHILTFKYTKSDGSVSTRTISILGTPTKLVSGVDISSLSMEDQAVYALRMDEIKAKFDEEAARINEVFDLKYNYRQFKPECMSDRVSETI